MVPLELHPHEIAPTGGGGGAVFFPGDLKPWLHNLTLHSAKYERSW